MRVKVKSIDVLNELKYFLSREEYYRLCKVFSLHIELEAEPVETVDTDKGEFGSLTSMGESCYCSDWNFAHKHTGTSFPFKDCFCGSPKDPGVTHRSKSDGACTTNAFLRETPKLPEKLGSVHIGWPPEAYKFRDKINEILDYLGKQ